MSNSHENKDLNDSANGTIDDFEEQLMTGLVLSDSLNSANEASELSDHRDRSVTENALEKLEYYCIALDEMIDVGKKYIDTRKEVSSLREIRRQLSMTHDSINVSTAATNRYAVIEDNIPEELKCPVCFEIFEGEIFQCVNGHSICYRCCETITECPECRVNYKDGKVRNRTVEKLMTSLKIDCLYSDVGCKEKMICGEMQVHVETCEFMNKPVRSPEYKEVRKQLRSKDGHSKRLEKRLDEANKRLMESKSAWYAIRKELCSKNSESKIPKLVEEYIQQFHLEELEKELTTIYVDLTEMIIIPK